MSLKEKIARITSGLLSKLTGWYFSRGAFPYWVVLSLDCLIVAFACVLGKCLELGRWGFALHLAPVTWGIVVCVFLFILAFRLFHT